MTPTTCDVDLVAAIMNAGYYVEFATGGYNNASAVSTALHKWATKIPDGRIITVNVIYVNPQDLAWMIPELASLFREGLPIRGLAVGAGIPAPEVATEWIENMELPYIGFKSANVDAIHQVLEIAKLHPTLPILLQWTGGRAGGHHSNEDFHQPILETYQAIREVINTILVGGSRSGDADGSWPYLSGQWPRAFNRAPTPFDVILLGTCIMTTLEAETSLDGKNAMVDAFGVPGEAWNGTLK